jgi:GNAT superfamily N-acetyltransferase
VTFRIARPDEQAALEQVLYAAFQDYMQGLGRDWAPPYEWLTARLEAGDVHLLEDDACRTLGLAVLGQDEAANTLSVDIVAVDPAAQGQGLGRALLEHAEAVARDDGRTAILLYTVAKYDHLLAVYRRFGFEVTHQAVKPGGNDPFPRAYMRKDLVVEPAN